MDIGMDLGATVSEAYHAKAPFAFTGKIGKLMIELGPITQKAERDALERIRAAAKKVADRSP
jgi:hypothetical protein